MPWHTHTVSYERRIDRKWRWKVTHSNGNVIATDGGQGFENFRDCVDSFNGFKSAVRWGRVAVENDLTTPM